MQFLIRTINLKHSPLVLVKLYLELCRPHMSVYSPYTWIGRSISFNSFPSHLRASSRFGSGRPLPLAAKLFFLATSTLPLNSTKFCTSDFWTNRHLFSTQDILKRILLQSLKLEDFFSIKSSLICRLAINKKKISYHIQIKTSPEILLPNNLA